MGRVDLPTFIYRRFLRAQGERTIWSFLRRRLIAWAGDPAATVEIHGCNLSLPLSHPLPIYLKKYRHYDRLPRRLSAFFHEKQARLTCIDVGANIGDTVAAFRMVEGDRFLAIEPNPGFRHYLEANWGDDASVVILDVLCGSERASVKVEIEEGRGTATLRHVTAGVLVEQRSLDDMLTEYPDFAAPDILKIDTDGHDFEVIAGACTLIESHRPAVLFECDVFGRETYVDDALATLARFREADYEQFLLYDNFGGFQECHSLVEPDAFRELLHRQLRGDFLYFDILVMREEDLTPFLDRERAHFTKAMSDRGS